MSDERTYKMLLSDIASGGSSDEYPGWDFVLIFNEQDFSITLVKGTYSDVRAKILARSPVLHQLVVYSQSNGDSCLKDTLYFNLSVRQNDLYLAFEFYNSSDEGTFAYFIWNSDDTFVYDD